MPSVHAVPSVSEPWPNDWHLSESGESERERERERKRKREEEEREREILGHLFYSPLAQMQFRKG